MKDEVYEFLTSAKNIKLRIRTKETQIKDLELMLLPGAIRYDKDRVISSPKADQMDEYLIRKEKLEEELESLKNQYFHQQKIVAEAIEQLPDEREQTVLMMRYIGTESYDFIAAELCLSVDRVFQIHRAGVDNLVDIVDKMKHYSELQ